MSDYYTENSYMTKEEFINMIQGLRFERVKNCDLELITGLTRVHLGALK